MNKNFTIAGLLLFISGVVFAALVPIETIVRARNYESKIGYVDIQRVLRESPAGRRAITELEKF